LAVRNSEGVLESLARAADEDRTKWKFRPEIFIDDWHFL
jgi:hypothetical protein